MMSVGSNSRVPIWPLAALTSTLPAKEMPCRAEISTKPPSPATLPPRAEMAPCAQLLSSAQTRMSPPSPDCPASARISVCAPIWVKVLATVPSSPARPPMRILPPSPSPEASIRAVSNTPTRSPLTVIVPPAPSTPCALRSPRLTTLPPVPTRVTTPPTFSIRLARTRPLLLTTSLNTWLAAEALSSTRPPSATRLPLFSTAAAAWPGLSVTSPEIEKCSSEAPSKLR